MKPLVVIGSAPCLEADLKALGGIERFDVMAVGLSSVKAFPRPIQYVANNHPENIPAIAEILKRRGDGDARMIAPLPGPGVHIVEPYRPPTGSSAITGTLAALKLGYRKICLCGCPLTGNAPGGNPYEEFREGWQAKRDELAGIVKSMSGWTRELLGGPTGEWLASAAVEHIRGGLPAVRETLTRWDYLIALAREYGWKNGAELGVWYGRTFFRVLDALPSLSLTGVDAWVESDRITHHRDQAENRRAVHRRQSAYAGRSRLLDMTTSVAAAYVPDMSLDFVFIDAAHDYKSVYDDICCWRPKVKPGGFLTGHDQDWPTVDAAVRDLIGSVHVYNAGGDHMWAWRLP